MERIGIGVSITSASSTLSSPFSSGIAIRYCQYLVLFKAPPHNSPWSRLSVTGRLLLGWAVSLAFCLEPAGGPKRYTTSLVFSGSTEEPALRRFGSRQLCSGPLCQRRPVSQCSPACSALTKRRRNWIPLGVIGDEVISEAMPWGPSQGVGLQCARYQPTTYQQVEIHQRNDAAPSHAEEKSVHAMSRTGKRTTPLSAMLEVLSLPPLDAVSPPFLQRCRRALL
jgi:hypothetical protein